MNGYLVVHEELPNSIIRGSDRKTVTVYEPRANKVTRNLTLEQLADTEQVISFSSPSLTVSQQVSRKWVVSSGPVLVDTSISDGDLYVDPLTTIVFVYVRSSVGGFVLVEIGYYANVCDDVTFTSSDDEPSSPAFGDLWQKTDTGELFTYAQDDSGGYIWAEMSSTAGYCDSDTITVSTVPPVSPVDGNIWFDLNSGSLMIYTTDQDSSQWVDYTE